MQIPGHIAVALAQHRLLTLYGQDGKIIAPPLFIASLFPDIVDKTVGYIFHAMPNGRHYTHNLFMLVCLSLIIALIWGEKAGYAWFIGHLGHLLADTRGGLVPWLFPIKKYHFKRGRLIFNRPVIYKEIIVLILVLIVHRLSR